MKVLLVLTSHDELGDTGRKTGFWLEELAAPYYRIRDAGFDIVLASPKGGRPPLDPKSNEAASQTDETRRFEPTPRPWTRSPTPSASTPSPPTTSTPSSTPAVTAPCGTWPRTPPPSG